MLFQVARCADETKLCPCLDMPSAPKTSPECMLPSYFYFKRLYKGTDPKPTEASSLFTNMLQWHSGSGPNTMLMLKTKRKQLMKFIDLKGEGKKSQLNSSLHVKSAI